MGKLMLGDEPAEAAKVLLPWHKPVVRRLGVTLDTAGGPTSNPDFTAPGGSFQ